MTNKQLQDYLKKYPDNMPIKLIITHQERRAHNLIEENILLSSTTAHINEDAPEDEWDAEGGKVELGVGEKYLLINPIIL